MISAFIRNKMDAKPRRLTGLLHPVIITRLEVVHDVSGPRQFEMVDVEPLCEDEIPAGVCRLVSFVCPALSRLFAHERSTEYNHQRGSTTPRVPRRNDRHTSLFRWGDEKPPSQHDDNRQKPKGTDEKERRQSDKELKYALTQGTPPRAPRTGGFASLAEPLFHAGDPIVAPPN